MRIAIVAFGSFLLALATAVAPAQSLQLADGSVLLAEVEPGSVTGEGLRVKRLDNGGTLELRWDHLSVASATAWRKRFDLAGDAQDEIRVRADEVEYEANGSRQTVLGRVDQAAGGEFLVVQSKGTTYRIRRADVRAVRQLEVPVMQVLTRDEYYREQLDLLQPGQDADKHVLLADVLMKVKDYDHANEHLLTAKQLDNSKNKPAIDALLAKLTRFKESAKELKLLDDITAARSRGQLRDFVEIGPKLLAQFEKDFPQSKLKAEFDVERRKFTEARRSFLIGQVAEKWRDTIRVVVEKAVADQSLTLQAARDYAQNKMTDDIVARVAAQLKLDPAEVKTLWASRKDTQVGKRTALFTYGVGSWVLQSAAILKDTNTGKEVDKQQKKAEPPASSPDVDRFAKLVQDALKRRRDAVQGQGEAKEQTEEGWWQQAERAEKISWLRAFYAEFGGQLVVTFASVQPCISCYAEGTVAEIAGDGKMVRNKCFLCQGTKYLRSFKAY
jgi:hypothetical protein